MLITALSPPLPLFLLQVEEGPTGSGLKKLKQYSTVKRVTPQRLVFRNLQYVNVSEQTDGPKISRPLKKFWEPPNNGRRIGRVLLRATHKQITSILQADTLWSMGITGKLPKINKSLSILSLLQFENYLYRTY